jgi:hypothetical protein
MSGREPDIEVFAEDARDWRSQDELTAALARAQPALAVRSVKPLGIPGFEWLAPAAEVFAVYIGSRAATRAVDLTTNQVVDRTVEAVVTWARSALRREGGWSRLRAVRRLFRLRPKRVVIYGPNREILRTVVVRRPDAEPEISGGDD